MTAREKDGRTREDKNPWARELDDAVRGVSGGLLFGIPLLYTMEVWWVGSHTSPVQMLVVLLLAFVLVFAMNFTGGFKGREEVSLSAVVIDTVEALALALVAAGAVLLVLGRIGPGTPVDAAVGKVVYEALPFAMGVVFARHYLKGERNPDERSHVVEQQERSALHDTLSDLGATAIGAAFIASSIAPTDEVPLIASGVSIVGIVAIGATSLAVSYAIVFQAGFANSTKRRQQRGVLQRPATETMVSYVVALVVAGVMLLLFQNVRAGDPLAFSLTEVVVLGLPASVGGAAGRLAV